jgi:hypothetical protein
MNILKHVIDKKSMQKTKKINVKWTLKDKIYNNNVIQNFRKLKIYILGKFQCTSLINFSFDDASFFKFYFDTTLTYYLNPHFSFSLCDKHNVFISKVHYESIIFFKFIQSLQQHE